MGKFVKWVQNLIYMRYIFKCNGSSIDWNFVVELCKRNLGASTSTPELSLVPKLKYEHVYLTSFSKMRVDLAAQVSKEYLVSYCEVKCYHTGA